MMRPRRLWPAVLAAVLTALAAAGAWQLGRSRAALTGETTPASHAQERAQALKHSFAGAVALLNARRYDEAASAWHEVLALAPRLPEAHVNMGYALIGLEQYALARDFFNSALELNARQHNAYFGLALALDKLGDRDGALGAMRTYVHLAGPGDRYRFKAEAAISKWQAARAAAPRVPENGNAAIAYPIRGKELR
jgi:tetratricopeptide (TPR) repeat protein